MTLRTLESAYPNYRHTFEGNDIKALDLYTEGGEPLGSVDDVLVDDEGRFRYLVVHATTWSTGKRILLPIGLARIDYDARRVYATGLSKHQVEQLPEYQPNVPVDHNHETQVRNVYRERPLEASVALESSVPLEGPVTGGRTLDPGKTMGTTTPSRTTEPRITPGTPSTMEMGTTEAIGTTGVTETGETRSTVGVPETDRIDTTETMATTSSSVYSYDRDPELYELNDRNHQLLKQHQDQLRARRNNQNLA
jgi:stress response protein YsnF